MQLKNEAAEHGRVLATLNGVEESRKAFRLIGGVLVERTVGEVKPAVEANKSKIDEVVATLEAELAEKRKRFFVLKVRAWVGGRARDWLVGGWVGRQNHRGVRGQLLSHAERFCCSCFARSNIVQRAGP